MNHPDLRREIRVLAQRVQHPEPDNRFDESIHERERHRFLHLRLAKVGKVKLMDDIPRVREHRLKHAALAVLDVPADVVGMEMGQENDIHVIWRNPARGEAVHKDSKLPLDGAGAIAGVDENGLSAGSHDVAPDLKPRPRALKRAGVLLAVLLPTPRWELQETAYRASSGTGHSCPSAR